MRVINIFFKSGEKWGICCETFRISTARNKKSGLAVAFMIEWGTRFSYKNRIFTDGFLRFIASFGRYLTM